MADPLVAFDTAKAHLQITDDDHDVEIESKLLQASDVIVDYLKDRADAGWSDGSVAVPDIVQAATLLMLAHLWVHRGDDFATNKFDEEIWNGIDRLLMRRRDPAYA